MDSLQLVRMFICAFMAACFIQSGFDKVTDWNGNLGWLTGHFSKTFLRNQVAMMLATVTVIEIAAGFFCLAAVATLLFHGPMFVPQIGLGLVCLNLVMLFTGQRIAKDYAGAVGLTGYFLIAVFGLSMMQP